MKKLKSLISPPYNLLLAAAVFVAALTPFFWKVKEDFHLHDTYIVFPFVYIIWLIVLILVLFWWLYYAVYKILLSKFLTWAHVAASILFILIVFTAGSWYHLPSNPASNSAGYSFKTMMENERRAVAIVLPVLLILLLGQLAFIINIVGGILKMAIRKHKESKPT